MVELLETHRTKQDEVTKFVQYILIDINDTEKRNPMGVTINYHSKEERRGLSDKVSRSFFMSLLSNKVKRNPYKVMQRNRMILSTEKNPLFVKKQ